VSRALLVTLTACAAPVLPRAVPAPVAPPPACLRITDDAPGAIRDASADGERLTFCIADDQCFTYDLPTGALAPLLVAPKRAAPPDAARVAVTNPDLQVCRGEDCKAITPAVLPNANNLHAATTADGAFAVVLLGDAQRGRGYAEVWDVARSRRTASFGYARGDFRCGEVAMLGETIYLSASTCGGPAARAALYSLKGRKLANVGGREFGSYGNAHVALAGNLWAFLDENGNQLVVQDVVRGKLVKTIDTTGLFTPDAAPRADAMGNPGEHALVRLDDTRVAIIAGAPATGRIATVDTATGTVTIAQPPHCAP
jgi:hypothetical protein